jgi:excisionase family DNA binding protein
MGKQYLTVAATADRTHWTVKAIRGRIARGQLPYRKLGRRVLIPEDELEKFLEALPGRTAKEAIEAVEKAR